MDPKWLRPYEIKDFGKGFLALKCIESGDIVKRVHGAYLKVCQYPPSEQVLHMHQFFDFLIFCKLEAK